MATRIRVRLLKHQARVFRELQRYTDWDAYWQQQHQRLYGTSVLTPDMVEVQVLQLAA